MHNVENEDAVRCQENDTSCTDQTALALNATHTYINMLPYNEMRDINTPTVKSTVSCVATPCSSKKTQRSGSASTFRTKKEPEQETSKQQTGTIDLTPTSAGFMYGLHFDTQDKSDVFP
jgi:hypothetical protein